MTTNDTSSSDGERVQEDEKNVVRVQENEAKSDLENPSLRSSEEEKEEEEPIVTFKTWIVVVVRMPSPFPTLRFTVTSIMSFHYRPRMALAN